MERGWRRQQGLLVFPVSLPALVACWWCSLVLSISKSSSAVSIGDAVLFSRFDGRVVAKLPFIPLSYIQGLSHRNLLGEDYTDCSFIFLYILCTMSIRQVSTFSLEQGKHSPIQEEDYCTYNLGSICGFCVCLFIPVPHIQSNSRLGSLK